MDAIQNWWFYFYWSQIVKVSTKCIFGTKRCKRAKCRRRRWWCRRCGKNDGENEWCCFFLFSSFLQFLSIGVSGVKVLRVPSLNSYQKGIMEWNFRFCGKNKTVFTQKWQQKTCRNVNTNIKHQIRMMLRERWKDTMSEIVRHTHTYTSEKTHMYSHT